MNHLSNYFQKAAVILVIVIALIIPNMRVYSFVGKYEVSSSAIAANNHYSQNSLQVEKPIAPAIVSVLLVAVIIGSGLAVGLTENQKHQGGVNPILSFRSSDKEYASHDFSQFDN